MVNGRQKGAAAEREIAKLLFDELGMTFKRDLEQYRAADHGDLICDEQFPWGYAVEMDTRCAMMIVRELLADAVSVSSVEGVNVKEL
mgnify:CR=1 FL=1